MIITNSPVADYTRYLDEQEERLLNLPECDCCGYKIQQERAVHIQGMWFCDECIDGNRDYTEEI